MQETRRARGSAAGLGATATVETVEEAESRIQEIIMGQDSAGAGQIRIRALIRTQTRRGDAKGATVIEIAKEKGTATATVTGTVTRID